MMGPARHWLGVVGGRRFARFRWQLFPQPVPRQPSSRGSILAPAPAPSRDGRRPRRDPGPATGTGTRVRRADPPPRRARGDARAAAAGAPAARMAGPLLQGDRVRAQAVAVRGRDAPLAGPALARTRADRRAAAAENPPPPPERRRQPGLGRGGLEGARPRRRGEDRRHRRDRGRHVDRRGDARGGHDLVQLIAQDPRPVPAKAKAPGNVPCRARLALVRRRPRSRSPRGAGTGPPHSPAEGAPGHPAACRGRHELASAKHSPVAASPTRSLAASLSIGQPRRRIGSWPARRKDSYFDFARSRSSPNDRRGRYRGRRRKEVFLATPERQTQRRLCRPSPRRREMR